MVTRLKFILFTACLFVSFANATPVVTLSADKLSPGESIFVKVINLPGNPQDWLTLVKVDAPASEFGEWFYTKGVTEGSWTFSVPKRPGNFEVRVFFDYPAGGQPMHARAPIEVEESRTTESTKDSKSNQSVTPVLSAQDLDEFTPSGKALATVHALLTPIGSGLGSAGAYQTKYWPNASY
jgi:hypothetical protein